jgi:hypothetical protein
MEQWKTHANLYGEHNTFMFVVIYIYVFPIYYLCLSCAQDGQRLRKEFVINLLTYDGNSRQCMIPLSVREYLSRITGLRQ